MRDEQRSYESNHWLYPAAYTGSPWVGFPLVRTDAANYTVPPSPSPGPTPSPTSTLTHALYPYPYPYPCP